jgi:predicted membrane-bound spermidine synthase
MLLLLAVPAPVAVLAALSFVTSAFLTIGDAVWFATLQRHIPEHAISRISSFDWLGSVALHPLGYVLVGPISDSLGVGRTLALAGALNLVCAAAVLTVSAVRALGEYPEAEAVAGAP